MKIILALVAGIAALGATIAAAGCGGNDASGARDDEQQVVAAFYPLAYATERVAGDGVEVTNLTPPGTEPHDVELSARSVERVRFADLVLLLGGGFQPSLERAAEDVDGTVLDLLQGLRLREPVEEQAEEDEHAEKVDSDPHVWLDPVRYSRIAGRIADAIPGASAKVLQRNLTELDREFRNGLARCDRRTIVTSHAAFGYLAERYGLEQVPIAGLSPEAEPTPQHLEQIVRDVRTTGATTIFFETLVSPRLAETVARETGAKTAVLNPIEGLTPDQADEGEDYLSLMRENLVSLRKALGCH
jgi:zinc transport system substrate-binding protein